MSKLRVGVLCGGQSAEHEVALRSAINVLGALDRNRYDVTVIGISKEGRWFLLDESQWLCSADDAGKISIDFSTAREFILKPWKVETKEAAAFDVVIPVLHGPRGEDGTVQGLLTLAGIPYVGAGVLGSAVGMDKDVMKRLLRDAGLPIGKFRCFTNNDADFQLVTQELGTPVFVKPANMGSSVGVSRVSTEQEFRAAVDLALRYDRKVIVEEFIEGREIEVSVLGNENARASLPGELKLSTSFYSYDAKYLDDDSTQIEIPAVMDPELVEKVRSLAVDVFTTLECRGLARVDFFLTPEGRFVVNEINTFPGFTPISMYPKLWEATGIVATELLNELIRLALEYAETQKALAHEFKELRKGESS